MHDLDPVRRQLSVWTSAASAGAPADAAPLRFIVATEDGALALHVGGGVLTPVFTRPGLPRVSLMSEEEARRVASVRGDGYAPIPAADLPPLRVRSLTASLVLLLAVEVWRQKHPDFRSSPGDETHPSILVNEGGRGTVLQPLLGLPVERLEQLRRDGAGFIDGRLVGRRAGAA